MFNCISLHMCGNSNLANHDNLLVSSCTRSRDQLKRLHGQRIADILKNSSILEGCCSFNEGLAATQKSNSQPHFHAKISVSHLKNAETAIMGYFQVGP